MNTAPGERPPQETSDDAGRWWRYVLLIVGAVWAALSTAYFFVYQPPHPISGPLRGWEWFWYPSETLAEMRLPSISTYLKSTHFAADGLRGWAVGAFGTIIQTKDGGATWAQQTSDTLFGLNSVSFAADGQRGLAVGLEGAILLTKDGGAAWAPQTSGTLSSLNSVSFVGDGQRGLAVGEHGTILQTKDGGATWALRTSGTQSSLLSVSFAADGQRGLAVGEHGTILQTKDGGATWAPQTSGTQSSLLSVSFAADGQRGLAIGEHGTILQTKDGGATWAPQTSGTQSSLLSVSFAADGQRGLAVGEHGAILQTKDGGATWAPQTSGTLSTLLSVSFADDGQRGLAVGGDVINSFILQTKDGGATWAPQTSGTLSALSSVSFAADGEHGWAVGLDGMILQTKDGGASWALQTSGTESLLLSVNFAANGQRGWAVGEHGTVLQTKDGGATWVPQTSGTQFSLNSVSFAADGQRGWAVGEHGTILRTKDGGAAWVPQTSGTQYWLFSVSFAADGQRGWTVGEHGTILQTNDGGASWVPQTSGTQSYLYSVSFTANGQRGLAVGEHGTILQTKDGGANWAVPQTSGTQSTLLSVNFSADGQRGWAVGEQGTILQTKDGGVTWASLTSGTQSYLSSVNFSADGQRGWVVGIRTVLQTKDGGANWNSYSREPALAYFVFLALTFVPLYFAVRKPKEPPAGEGSIANAYIADTVLTAAEAAGTQVGAIAAGLASYLENPKTDAPLVIAITGPWGSGKSSLMNILRDALRAKGFQTAWFNAWHNQSEEHLFAAVLASLRSKALPHWWTRRGIRARIRLTFKRFGRMWLRLLLGLAGIVFISTVVWNLQVDLNKLLDWTSPDKVLASLAIPAALLPVIALWKVFSAFGADPTKLTKTLRGATAAEAWEATSFRERFAEEFGEVTHALQPQTLTLFIDDLDRCHPDQMLIILEAVNFLASSGSCYIVLGMEQKVLMHCLEQKLDWLQDLPAPERAPAGTSRAQLWLEKLIQLRLSVAPLSWEELQSLLSTRSERGSRVKRPPTSDLERLGLCVPGFLRTVGMALALVALGGAVGSGAWQLGQSFVRHSKPTAEEKTEKPPAWFSEVELAGKLNNTDVILRMQPKTGYQNPAVSTGKQDVNPDLGGKQSALDKVPEEIGPVMIQPGQNATPNLTWIIVLMLIVLVLIVLWGALKVLTMRYLSSIDDSKTFTSTLKDFIPCINAACQTPRAVKHLINGVRLYAMLLRHWSLDPKNVEDASTRLELGQEADLVIYGILEKLCPDQLRAALLQPNEAAFTLESIDPKLSVFNNRAARAIRSLTAYNSREDFERLVRSIEIK